TCNPGSAANATEPSSRSAKLARHRFMDSRFTKKLASAQEFYIQPIDSRRMTVKRRYRGREVAETMEQTGSSAPGWRSRISGRLDGDRGPSRSYGPSRGRCATRGDAGHTRSGRRPSISPIPGSSWPWLLEPFRCACRARELRADNAVQLFPLGSGIAYD